MLRWLQSGPARGPLHGARRSAVAAADEQACPGLARALKRILAGGERPEVLDLGQFSRSAAVYLATRGARVFVESFEPPPPKPKRKRGEDDDDVVEPVVIRHPDERFDLVLAWEHGDFVPPERLREFGGEIARVLAPGGWLLMYARDDPGSSTPAPEAPASYRLLADDRLVRETTPAAPRPRWAHANRTIERALTPLAVQSIHLQRNRIREFLVRKPDLTG